ncbi:carnosine N-methyltransferase-like isoform X2 [Phalaenopsis equestris]|uniref:carnosine N-methyltransferase-like isoform X2 n=1 Tax=Phalaenopsis equestris TaxID=78828 RepID=UPI0009E2B200|nr:carnosine N-methyltransferase-like isoform X2 [Phalaenopsis equestris]
MSREEGLQRRYSRLEEALEIKSLRRIISAYINYADAAEEDVKRYERSFRKLSREHKGLLSHLPLKFQRFRRCISANSFFIMNMLQAFDPPFDMSQDIDFDGHSDIGRFSNGHLCTHASHHMQDYSAYVKGSVPESIDIASGPELSSCSGSCDQTPSNRNNEKQEISSESSCSLVMNMNTPNGNTNLIDESMDKVKLICNLDASLHDSTPNGNVRCIIRNIVRDWAVEGQKERDQCYKPILEELNRLFPDRCKERPPSCLVPGAGLGRLALEISCLGFVSQGNEFSYYMMICSSFILNQTEAANQWIIYPWIHGNCNSLSDDDQFRPISFPDIQPASAGITEGFSMCGGDFIEVYNDMDQEGAWDAVVTCFFLDTAHNIVEYIEIISKVLKDGGVWINLGPLLYHFADSCAPEEEMSIEISLEDAKKVALQYGFEIEMEKIIETTYTANPRSMMQNHYYAAFWTMKKKPRT